MTGKKRWKRKGETKDTERRKFFSRFGCLFLLPSFPKGEIGACEKEKKKNAGEKIGSRLFCLGGVLQSGEKMGDSRERKGLDKNIVQFSLLFSRESNPLELNLLSFFLRDPRYRHSRLSPQIASSEIFPSRFVFIFDSAENVNSGGRSASAKWRSQDGRRKRNLFSFLSLLFPLSSNPSSSSPPLLLSLLTHPIYPLPKKKGGGEEGRGEGEKVS